MTTQWKIEEYKISDKMTNCNVIGTTTNEIAYVPDIKDAHLIAASPDMYEALQAIISLSENQGRLNLIECVGMARAAIAKAEGKP